MKKLIFLVLIIICSCKSKNEQKESHNSITLEGLKSRIDSLFNTRINANEPGAALLVSYDGEMLIGKGYGLRNMETKEPITKSTNMRMGSVSKQFTDLSLLTLVDKGLLSLNDTVYKFWPYEVFKNITVTQLINHTSGIADYEAAFMNDWDRTKVVENKDVLAWLETNPAPRFKPGEKWEYSNTAYIVLAQLTEKLSRKDFAEYAKEAVFDKAGMKNTNFYSLAHPIAIKERAFCYEKDSLGQWEQIDGFFMNGVLGDGAVYTNLIDYFTYDQALRNHSIVSEKLHQLLFEPSSMALPKKATYPYGFLKSKEEHYAMGWFVTEDIAFHTGSWNGTRTIVVRDKERPLTLTIFMNSAEAETRTFLMEHTYNLVDSYLNSK
ncbi:serine hydrolase domain-containing protein [Maribacter arcticus]|uniref:serine hydrolase domain-containing protein n=1 Tax=Maribacter arcticus TaxID=561365 RepID=UPI0030016B81|tara:strand:- start:146 stop:1282 length:1137 start_codon:yes stop_codon:yes gene_type:complete